ncbi:MAG: hypothetical protein KZQ92_05540, partial [Candidatus Thiodiazotropha sp. (ex Lucinoma borealis)]|nr:hypothetical protein [Candidatus Thiodiazotropha sp. (ex Lucinoma borealis)]
MMTLIVTAIAVVVLMTLAYRGSGANSLSISLALLALISALLSGNVLITWIFTALFAISLLISIPSARRNLFAKP